MTPSPRRSAAPRRSTACPLLIAAGLDAGAASTGVFGALTEHGKLMANPTGRFFGAQGAWLWPVVAVGAAVIVLAALRWLAALLFSTDRSGDLAIRAAGRPRSLPAGSRKPS